jgi:hypothetical protein
MTESESKKERKALIIAIVLLGVVTTAVFGYKAIANPAQIENTPSQTAEFRPTDAAEEPREEPPTATIPPTETPTKQPPPTATATPTHTPTNTAAPRTTISIMPELFIYHTP